MSGKNYAQIVPGAPSSHTTKTKLWFSLFGPPSVCKGYLVNNLTSAFKKHHNLTLHTIGMGDKFRDMLRHDPAFTQRWGATIANGDLVDDQTTCELYDTILFERTATIGINDGIPRSPAQVQHVAMRGTLGKGSTLFLLHGSLKTCHGRFLHRLERSGGKRPDDAVKKFEKRFWRSYSDEPAVRIEAEKTGCIIKEVDANKPLEDIFMEVNAYIVQKWEDMKSVLNQQYQQARQQHRNTYENMSPSSHVTHVAHGQWSHQIQAAG